MACGGRAYVVLADGECGVEDLVLEHKLDAGPGLLAGGGVHFAHKQRRHCAQVARKVRLLDRDACVAAVRKVVRDPVPVVLELVERLARRRKLEKYLSDAS